MYMSSQPQFHRARHVDRVENGISERDGSGTRRVRILGTADFDRLDPFLLFEAFGSDGPVVTAPDSPLSPYRGFETLTYVTDGRVRHIDDIAGEHCIGAGEALWMTAGRGLRQTDRLEAGSVQGFQLWLNLPRDAKMQAPVHRAVEATDIPAVIFRTAEVKVLAGRYYGLLGPIASPATQPFIADVSLRCEGEVTLDIPDDHEGLVYVFSGGGVAIEQTLVHPGQAGVLSGGNVLNLVAGADGARVLVATARPLKEPVARHGPFVMNTAQDLSQAFKDYQNGTF